MRLTFLALALTALGCRPVETSPAAAPPPSHTPTFARTHGWSAPPTCERCHGEDACARCPVCRAEVGEAVAWCALRA